MAAGSMTVEDIERRIRPCPTCKGEGYVNVKLEKIGSVNSNMTLIDADECEVCEGTGEISNDS